MAFLGMHGFDELTLSNPGADLSNNQSNILFTPLNWTGVGGNKQAGQLGGSSFGSPNNSHDAMFLLTPGAGPFIFGTRWSPGSTAVGASVFTWHDTTLTIQCTLTVNASGKLTHYRGNNATALGSGNVTIVANSYYYIEVKLTLGSGTSGAIEVHVNGVLDFTLSSINNQQTANNNIKTMCLVGNTGANQFWDDCYILDTTGPAPYNDFLCNATTTVRIETLFPTQVSSIQFSPGTNSQYAIYNTSINTGVTFATGTCFYFPWTSVGTAAPPAIGGQITGIVTRFQTTFAGNCKMAIYDNTGAGGAPGSLLGTSNVVTSATGNATFGSAPDITFTFASPVTITGGTGYWIAFLTDSNAVLWTRSAAALNSTQAVTYVSGFPATAGPTATLQGSMPYLMAAPYTGVSVLNIQEVNSDGDTTYNQAAASAIDLFTHGALSSTPVTIFAVQITHKVRKDDVVNVNSRSKLVSGATTQNGTQLNLATAYQWMGDIYTTDPNTGSAWSAAAVNASKIGYERV